MVISRINVHTKNIDQISSKLTPVFKEYGVRKAILFGSYARGEETVDSDVDLLVDSGLRGMKFFGLLEDITTGLEKDVDLFDYRQFDESSDMFKDIQKNGVVIYEA